MAADTQIAAWMDLQGALPNCQAKVLDVIRSFPCSSWDVAAALGLPINRVSGRITELVEQGKVMNSGRRTINPLSGKRVIVWQSVS